MAFARGSIRLLSEQPVWSKYKEAWVATLDACLMSWSGLGNATTTEVMDALSGANTNIRTRLRLIYAYWSAFAEETAILPQPMEAQCLGGGTLLFRGCDVFFTAHPSFGESCFLWILDDAPPASSATIRPLARAAAEAVALQPPPTPPAQHDVSWGPVARVENQFGVRAPGRCWCLLVVPDVAASASPDGDVARIIVRALPRTHSTLVLRRADDGDRVALFPTNGWNVVGDGLETDQGRELWRCPQPGHAQWRRAAVVHCVGQPSSPPGAPESARGPPVGPTIDLMAQAAFERRMAEECAIDTRLSFAEKLNGDRAVFRNNAETLAFVRVDTEGGDWRAAQLRCVWRGTEDGQEVHQVPLYVRDGAQDELLAVVNDCLVFRILPEWRAARAGGFWYAPARCVGLPHGWVVLPVEQTPEKRGQLRVAALEQDPAAYRSLFLRSIGASEDGDGPAGSSVVIFPALPVLPPDPST